MAYIRILGLIVAIATSIAIAQNAPTSPAQSTPTQTQSPAPAQQPSPQPPAATKQDSQAAPSEITIQTVDPEKKKSKKEEEAELAQEPQYPMPKLSDKPMSKQTRVMVVRSLEAEFVFARKPLPLGQRGVVLKDGRLSPPAKELAALIATYGPAVKPGDRAQITDMKIGDKSILFELNGGSKKKKKWYQHIEVGGMGGMTPVSQDSGQGGTGTTVELAFDKFVPEMTGDQVRELLSPILDFHAKSAAEAYIETVPPKVKQAIKDHKVLVGMNKEMVQYSKGRPERKVREKDSTGKDYEEWIYGAPPEEVDFVRFNGDQVVRLEVMGVDGQKVVKTEKEINIDNGLATLAKTEEPKKPVHAPTLKRPGEQADADAPVKQTGANTRSSSTSHDDQEWGVPKPGSQGTPPDPNAPKPPDATAGVPK